MEVVSAAADSAAGEARRTSFLLCSWAGILDPLLIEGWERIAGKQPDC